MNTPTINMNLASCRPECLAQAKTPPKHPAHGHVPGCPGEPLLVPLPIERSVTFQVALGECQCALEGREHLRQNGRHWDSCPARPVKVSCSISGKTWEKSRAEDAERADGPGRPNFTEAEHMAAIRACEARWALVKALVLGWNGEAVRTVAVGGGLDLKKVDQMFQQRRTVYAALADMARAEEAHASAYSRAWGAMGEDSIPSGRRSAHWVLAHYVDRLIEQVGILNGGQ